MLRNRPVSLCIQHPDKSRPDTFDGDSLSLTDNLPDSNIPKYIILSHTWGNANEEVTFLDMANGASLKRGIPKRPAFAKIRFCAEQTLLAELDHFWIDTCCIDKSSSAELSEAINSMYKWYENADTCLVYLSDITVGNPLGDLEHCSFGGVDLWGCKWFTRGRTPQGLVAPPRVEFFPSDRVFLEDKKSKWFTRGWTLQELIAPRHVKFFSSNRVFLGEKSDMAPRLQEITRVPEDVLTHKLELADFGFNERLTWLEGRETTRDEDMVYCLFGIFDIPIGVIYGEGTANARYRFEKELYGRGVDQRLKLGRHFQSPSGEYRLTLRKDGNLVVSKGPDGPILWASGTAGKGVEEFSQQVDGNLVLFDRDGKAIWKSETERNPNMRLLVEDNGNVILTADKGVTKVWSTRTDGGQKTGLNPNQKLTPNQFIQSPSGQYRLILRSSGNIILRDVHDHNKEVWSAKKEAENIFDLVMQTDGNLVAYRTAARAIWASQTHGNPGSRCEVLDNGKIIIRGPPPHRSVIKTIN